MKPVPFKQHNKTLVGPKGSGILDLPVHSNGESVISCWEFTEAEIAELIKTKHVYLSVYSGETSPPVWLSVEPPFTEFQNPEVLHSIFYTCLSNAAKADIPVFMGADIPTPKILKIGRETYLRDLTRPPVYTPNYKPKENSYYIRETIPGEERDNFGEQYALIYVAYKFLEGLIQIPPNDTKIINMGSPN